MPRRAGLSLVLLLIVGFASAIALYSTRPVVAGDPATGAGDALARNACWLAAAALTGWLLLTAFTLSIALADRGYGRARRALRWAPPIAGHALRAALAGSLAVAPPPPPVTVHVDTDGHLTPGPRPVRPAPATTTTVPRPAPRPAPPQPRRA